MTYQEICLKRAQMLIDSANGVKFQCDADNNDVWIDIYEPAFDLHHTRYRRKPVIKRHEAVVLWVEFNNGGLWHGTFSSEADADCYVAGYLKSKNGKEIKRETVWVEINE